eukprot:Unigene12000_Nuclearia_a/m.36496 Unigene12000_Nuclearia_a/g.36496  ORF Unigene12000_Nuclearia_a/g.36496 Unigene12000_Nuclearia_a/m.36496 type:complete len:369 (-) Unigene12000_Nuclearia_a:395-1501(-)
MRAGASRERLLVRLAGQAQVAGGDLEHVHHAQQRRVHTGVDAKTGGDAVEAAGGDHADVVERHLHFDRLGIQRRTPAGAVEQDREARPGFRQTRLAAFGNIDHAQRAGAAGLVRLQHDPVAVPEVAVVVELAVAVLVVQRRVVEVRMRGDRHRQDAGAFFETDFVRVDGGRPHVGEHIAAGQLAGRRGRALAGLAGHRHVERGDVLLGADLGVDDVEIGGHGLVGGGRNAAGVGLAVMGVHAADGQRECGGQRETSGSVLAHNRIPLACSRRVGGRYRAASDCSRAPSFFFPPRAESVGGSGPRFQAVVHRRRAAVRRSPRAVRHRRTPCRGRRRHAALRARPRRTAGRIRSPGRSAGRWPAPVPALR